MLALGIIDLKIEQWR